MTTKLYETEKLYVRPFEKSDLTEQYRSWFHDVDITRHNSHGLFPYTKEQMNKFLAQLESSDDIVWAVIAKPESSTEEYKQAFPEARKDFHIGNIALQRINWINRSAEFACVFGEKAYWSKGFCTEAARLLFDHGFNRLNLHRIFTGTAATNVGMQKVAQKLGMKEEGIFKDGTFLEGKYVNILAYGILKNEWKNR